MRALHFKKALCRRLIWCNIRPAKLCLDTSFPKFCDLLISHGEKSFCWPLLLFFFSFVLFYPVREIVVLIAAIMQLAATVYLFAILLACQHTLVSGLQNQSSCTKFTRTWYAYESDNKSLLVLNGLLGPTSYRVSKGIQLRGQIQTMSCSGRRLHRRTPNTKRQHWVCWSLVCSHWRHPTLQRPPSLPWQFYIAGD